jgi:glucose/mannose-6-phosphate isomerase
MHIRNRATELNEATIRRIDASDMRGLLLRFPEQVEEAIAIGERSKIRLDPSRVASIVVTGLGGSAIGGDLLRSYLADEVRIPIVVNRHYSLPEFVSRRSLVIVSSYSGNTEETIAAHRDALKRGARVLCISSNGATERLAKHHRNALIKIPKGFPPRAALGYSFFPVLVTLIRSGLVRSRLRDFRETVRLLKKKAVLYGELSSSSNDALSIARKFKGRLPVIYSTTEHFDSVNLRWRTQLAENAKVLAYGNVLPEMNHNELVGWNVLKKLMKEIVVVILRDADEHPRVRVRLDLTKKIVAKYSPHNIEVKSEGESLLARMFSLIYLGDWVSYYLAVLNRVDPTPVKVIDYLKSELTRVE